jgi:hypothetical protein
MQPLLASAALLALVVAVTLFDGEMLLPSGQPRR